MGIIKKNPSSTDQNQVETKETVNDNPKLIGKVIKQDFLGKELLAFDFNPEKINRKIIKKEEVSLPVNQVVEEIKDVNIVGKSMVEYELEEEKKKYEKINQELQEKIKEYQEKEKKLQELEEKIILEAKSKGEQLVQELISEAQNKAQEILKKAFEEGFQQGINQAYQQVQQEYHRKIQELQEEINKVINIRKNLFKEMEKEFIDFVFLVAEKVINKKVQEEPNVVISSLKELLTKVERSKTLTIWVNPQELEEVRNHKQQLTYMLEDVENINIIPDERIEIGGCIIETNFGKIDSRISTKLEVLKEIVLRSK